MNDSAARRPAVLRPHDRPDFRLPGAGVVKVSTWDVGTPDRQRATLAAIERAWTSRPWPEGGPLAYTVHRGDDGRTLLHYSQWPGEQAYEHFFRGGRSERNAEIDAAVPGVKRLGLHAYEPYGGFGGHRVPGCVVVMVAEFGAADGEHRRRWADAVLAATGPGEGAYGDGARGGSGAGVLGARLHLGTGGDRVLAYTEWESAEAHETALALAGPGGGSGGGWAAVRAVPGVRRDEVRRYTPGIALVPGD
jgi:hypothetical protein